jgi:hypothetical protein
MTAPAGTAAVGSVDDVHEDRDVLLLTAPTLVDADQATGTP